LSTAPIPPDYDDQSIPDRLHPPRRRTKTIFRIASTLFILVAALLVGFVVLLHNHSFRQSLLRIALPKVGRALGTDVHIRDFSLQLSFAAPSLSIDNIVVDGASPAQSPLFQADHIEIGLQVVSILKRKWYFNNVITDRPVLHLNVDQDGNTNLPRRGTSKNGSSIFDLGIRHVILRHGELYYNDRRTPLDASLRDVALQSRFDPQSKRYSGRLSYQNGRIHFRDWNPLVHSLESEFEATPEAFIITHCTLNTGASQVKVEATLNDFAHLKAKGTYQASLDSVDLEQILHRLPLRSGVVRLAGSAQFQSDPNRTVLQTLSLDGNLNGISLGIRTAAIDTELRDITADYLLHGGDIDIRNLRARILGGTLVGSYSMHDLAAAQQSQLHAVLRNVSLSSIQAITHPTTRKQFRLGGAANLAIEANWQKAFDAFVARGSADLKGTLASVQSAGAFHIVPIEGNIKVAYSAPAAEMTLTGSYLRTPKTTVRLSGTVSRHQSLHIQAQSDELHEVESVAIAFGLIREPVELYGAGSFNGTVRGSTGQPQIEGHLSSPSLKIRGTEWRMVRATLDASPSHLALRTGEVSAADNAGRLTFDVNVSLDRWSYAATGPFQIDLNAARLNISQLMSLADPKTPITGTLSARVSLYGSKDNIVGQGTVNLNQFTVLHENIPSLTLNFRGDGDSLRVHLNMLIATGSLQGDVTYFPRRKVYDGRLQAMNIGLDQLQTFRMRGIRVTGALSLTAKGAGSLDDPNLDFTAYVLRPQIENYKLGDISLAANIANRVAHIVFDSQAPTALHGRGKVELTGNYLAEAAVDSVPMPLAPLFAVYLPAQAADLSGQTELHAMINGPLKNPSTMTGQITLPTLSLAYRQNIQLANTQPIHLEYRKGVLTLTKTGIRGTSTNVQLEGALPVVGTGSISLIAAGNINLRLVSIINPDYTSSGEIEFNINGYGQRTNPDFKGQVKIVDASLSASSIPVALQNGNGVLNLVDDRLDIDRFQGSLSNGAFTARGNITYRPAVQLNLVMAANGIRTAYPPGVREDIDTNLTLTGPLRSPLLRGQVHVNELSFSQAFNFDEVLYKFERTGRVLPAGSGKLNLDLTVQSTNELTPATDQLTLNGAANLRVRGTVAQPALWGTIRLNSGELLFRGARYMLKPSTVDFVDTSGMEPRLNIAVETRVKQYNIQILLLGPLDELRTTISSEPPLPSADTINLLIFGRTNQPITTEPTGNLGAVSLLASGVTNTITDRLQKIAGISELSIDPVLDNNEQGSAVGVTVQQRVTANLLVTFTSDPSSTKRQVVEVEYHATPKVSVIGVLNQNGGFATDVRIRKTW
jgi:translocation and assembly module TamB